MLNQQEGAARDAAEGARQPPSGGTTLYARSMPGGGYVKVELVARDRGQLAVERRCGRVVIEPRSAGPRRDDDAPLVVEEVEGEDEGAIVAELFRIARDNAAIARRVLRRRADVRRGEARRVD